MKPSGLPDTSAVALFTSLLVLCALILELARAWRRYLARPPSRGREAEQTALDLLKQWLSSAQLAQYESKGHFEVTGLSQRQALSHPRSHQMNIYELDEHGAQVAVWCFGPEGCLPVGDVMLAQKIALETYERAALAVANRCR
jgi:hypothetical protein